MQTIKNAIKGKTSPGKRDAGSTSGNQESRKASNVRSSKKEEERSKRAAEPQKNTNKGGKGNRKQNRTVQQSASNPGNRQGLVNKKSDPFVNFGPILKEFLAFQGLVNKSVSVVYNQNTDKFAINVTFTEIKENGVSLKDPVTKTIEEYMSMRESLLKKTTSQSRYLEWVARLLDRVQIDLSDAKPRVDPRSVQKFVEKHLSPVERTVLQLSAAEWDSVDVNKLGVMMEPALAVLESYYPNGRTEFFIKAIISDDAPDVEPINWVQVGIGACNKGTLLSEVRVKKDTTDYEKFTISLGDGTQSTQSQQNKDTKSWSQEEEEEHL